MFDAIKALFTEAVTFIAGSSATAEIIYDVLLAIVGLFAFHSAIYTVIGIFFTRRFAPAKQKHKYAVMIAARNEAPVIKNLLDSIKAQDYGTELVTVFVVADNCTDDTAAIARQNGAVCYERTDPLHRTKGYALQFLVENIRRDYGIDAFDGYFVFDADNLLEKTYISRMNDAFDSGVKIITSYRNTKNFDENWLAASYALHWIRSIRVRHRARSVLRLATNIQGTGFLFANELIQNGWNYTSLTEDRAFTADAVAHGYEISYNDAAMFYDEQPTKVRFALRQRLRWSKGHLMAFRETGWYLFKNIFVGNCYKNTAMYSRTFSNSLLEGIRTRWASFDTLGQLIPKPVIKLVLWLVLIVFVFVCHSYVYGIKGGSLFGGSALGKVLSFVFGGVSVTVAPGWLAAFMAVVVTFVSNSISRLGVHLSNMVMAIYVFIAERKRIKPIPWYKKIWFTVMWPTFDAIHRWTMYIAVFAKVEWKPIPHTSSITISDIENNIEDADPTAEGR